MVSFNINYAQSINPLDFCVTKRMGHGIDFYVLCQLNDQTEWDIRWDIRSWIRKKNGSFTNYTMKIRKLSNKFRRFPFIYCHN